MYVCSMYVCMYVFCMSFNNKLQKSVTSDLRPNDLRYKVHGWLLSWIHFMLIIRVITFLIALNADGH